MVGKTAAITFCLGLGLMVSGITALKCYTCGTAVNPTAPCGNQALTPIDCNPPLGGDMCVTKTILVVGVPPLITKGCSLPLADSGFAKNQCTNSTLPIAMNGMPAISDPMLSQLPTTTTVCTCDKDLCNPSGSDTRVSTTSGSTGLVALQWAAGMSAILAMCVVNA